MDKFELVQEADPTVIVAAKHVARRFRGYVDVEDLVQEGRVWVLEHLNRVRECIDVEDERELRRGLGYLFVSVSRATERYARRQKASTSGYRTEDEWFANRKIICEVLPIVLGPGIDGYETRAETEIASGMDPAEGGGHAALVQDVAHAWTQYPDPLLQRLYGSDGVVDRKAIALDFNVTTSTIYRRENKALDRLIDALGGSSPWR